MVINDKFVRIQSHTIFENLNADGIPSDYHKINNDNMQKFVKYIAAENWDTVYNATEAQSKYDQFILTYTKYYDSAFLTKHALLDAKTSE